MHLLWQVWLLGALLAGRGSASPPMANMDIWEIDSTCYNYFDTLDMDPSQHTHGGVDQTEYIQEQFSHALDLAIAAKQALTFCLQKRPSKKYDPREYRKWVRIAESMAVTLGFYPKENVVESPSDRYWRSAFDIYNNIITTLQSSKNNPQYGYNPVLAKSPGRMPLIVCGENWDWVGRYDYIPGTKMKPNDVSDTDYLLGDTAVGIWWKNHRYAARYKVRQRPILCPTTAAAQTSLALNMIILGDVMFTDLYTESWTEPEDVPVGEHLDILLTSSAAIVLHELTHWFGGIKTESDGTIKSFKTSSYNIRDQHAVNENGMLLYSVDGVEKAFPKPLSSAQSQAKNAKPVVAHDTKYVLNLAVQHKGSQEAYSGPKVALGNGDSLTAFAVMMYYDNYNWAKKGIARKMT